MSVFRILQAPGPAKGRQELGEFVDEVLGLATNIALKTTVCTAVEATPSYILHHCECNDCVSCIVRAFSILGLLPSHSGGACGEISLHRDTTECLGCTWVLGQCLKDTDDQTEASLIGIQQVPATAFHEIWATDFVQFQLRTPNGLMVGSL